MPSPATRFDAREANTTVCPSGEIAGRTLGPLGSPLPVSRLRLTPPPATLATNTSLVLFPSPPTRPPESDWKATMLPSPLTAGQRLSPAAGESTCVVVLAARSRT